MKKFNPEEELKKIQNKNISINTSSRIKGSLIPALLLACFGVSILGTTISNSLSVDEEKYYTVNIDIINGQQTQYIKKVSQGPFEATIESDATFGSINCTKGYLSYDSETNKVSSTNISEDTDCILSFMEDGTKNIELSQLKSINDNDGKSYYFKGNSQNNYFKIGNTMFRIIRINGDGTYRLITNDNISNSSFGTTNDYNNSNIKNILNDWINNFKINNIVEKDYDYNNYQNIELDNLINMENYYLSNVGLLSVKEAYLISDGITESYLDGNYYLANGNGLENVYIMNGSIISNQNSNIEYGIRPVINIKIDKLKGQGTEELPYEIG